MATNRSKVLHKQVYRAGAFGSTLNTTLCGRLHKGQDYNVADSDQQVTCKFCLQRLTRSKA